MSRLEIVLQLAKVGMMATFLAVFFWLLLQGKVTITLG